MTDVDVLIAGAGPVSLPLAIELGQRGIRCLAVERNNRVNGPALSRFENAFNGCHVRNELYSEEAQWVPTATRVAASSWPATPATCTRPSAASA